MTTPVESGNVVCTQPHLKRSAWKNMKLIKIILAPAFLIMISCASHNLNPPKSVTYDLSNPVYFPENNITVTCIKTGEMPSQCHGGETRFRQFLIVQNQSEVESTYILGGEIQPIHFELNGTNYVLELEPERYSLEDNQMVLWNESVYFQYQEMRR